MWNEKFGPNANPAGDRNATNEGVGTNAVANDPPSGVFFRGNDYNDKYGDGHTKSIIVELNSYAEGSNLGGQTDLGLAGSRSYLSKDDVRDEIGGGPGSGKRRKALEGVIANTNDVWKDRSAGAPGGTSSGKTKIQMKVVRGKYRTSNPSDLITFQANTARAAADDNDTVLGAFDVAV